ncbi:hypothetical protein ACFQ88_27580 [Paenibacillus sp. NPDC056579]|uniref:hypothetical protein n=1 Tax=Paenibacillus sp. NPDC056579 TaxID=3345871 RepID=UPI00367FE02D
MFPVKKSFGHVTVKPWQSSNRMMLETVEEGCTVKACLIVLVCGMMTVLTAAQVSAAQPVQAMVTPAKFQYGGESSGLGNDNQPIRYDGELNEPVRWMSERMGFHIESEGENRTVYFSFGKLDITDPRVRGFKTGNLLLSRDTTVSGIERTRVTGQLKVGIADSEQVEVKASLSFYNDKHELLGEVPLDGDYRLLGTHKFETVVYGDLRRYASVELRVHSMNGRLVTDEPRVPLTEIVKDDLRSVSRIEIRYGPAMLLEVREETRIRAITDKLREMKLAKSFHQEPMSGYLFYMDIYTGGHKIRYSTGLNFDGVWYDPNEQTDSFNQFITGLQ